MTPSAGDGLILRIAPHGESDKLVTWYSPQSGRITAIAKGAQKSKKRFSNKLEPFSQLCLYYRPPRSASGLHFLEDADLVRAHIQVRQQYPKYLTACCISELTLRFTRELDADSRIYTLLVWAMAEINRNDRFYKYPLFFHLKLLQLVGYMPDFTTCCRCGGPVNEASIICLPPQGPGGAILACRSCRPVQVAEEKILSLQTIRILDFAQHADLLTLRKLQPSTPCIMEGLDMLQLYSQHLLQTDMHAWRILRRQLMRAHQPELDSRHSRAPACT